MGPALEDSIVSLDVPAPARPTTLEQTGLASDGITSLIVKWLNAGEASTRQRICGA